MVGPKQSAGRKEGKKRTLAEELAELTNPAPAFRDEDPEEFDGFGADARQLYDEDEDLEDGGFKPSSRSGDQHLRLRSDIVLEGEEYAGKAASRKALLGQDSDEEDELAAPRERAKGATGGGESEDAEEEDEDEEDGEEDDDGGEARSLPLLVSRHVDGGEDAEMEALDREYAQLRQEEQEVLKSVRPQAEAERKKGRAVAHQRALWDRTLELRISLQRPLQEAARLPHPPARAQLCAANEDAASAYASLAASAWSTLRLLGDLQQALMVQNGAIKTAYEAINANGKRGREDEAGEAESWEAEEGPQHSGGGTPVDATWQRMEHWGARLAPYRDAAVDRWHRKTMLSSGAAAAKGRLRALSQSVSQQVATAMGNPTRLIQRARVKVGAVRVVGQAAEQPRATGTQDEVDAAAMDGIDMGRSEPDGDVETYDDSDFYQQLLREFLEMSDPSALGGTSMRALRKLRNSKKKVVDRRASKGRKIRYTVLPQLVNFMAPEPMEIPPVALKLFGTLFGQKAPETEMAS